MLGEDPNQKTTIIYGYLYVTLFLDYFLNFLYIDNRVGNTDAEGRMVMVDVLCKVRNLECPFSFIVTWFLKSLKSFILFYVR